MPIRIARGERGGETALRCEVAGAVTPEPRVQISWVGANKFLSPNGWQNIAVDLRAKSVRRDVVIVLDSSLTNHIEVGTQVGITIPELNVSEQMLWPVLGSESDSDDIRQLRERIAELEGQLAQASQQRERVEQELAETRAALATAYAEIEELKKGGGGNGKPTPGNRIWQKLAAALLLGLIIGGSGAYGYYEYWPSPNGETPAQLRRMIDRLRTEAFAPLDADVTNFDRTKSPKGKPPDRVARATEPDRRHAFYNEGVESMRARDPAEGVYWYKQSVALCQADALAHLGDAYFSGTGVASNQRAGFQLLRCASALGSSAATSRLEELLRGREVPLGPQEYGDLYRRSAR